MRARSPLSGLLEFGQGQGLGKELTLSNCDAREDS